MTEVAGSTMLDTTSPGGAGVMEDADALVLISRRIVSNESGWERGKPGLNRE